MSSPARERATVLLQRLSSGDTSVSEELLELVYSELHQLAQGHMARENPAHTLQPTALVHEAYLRLSGAPERSFESRKHFFALASRVMRNLLVDHARERKARRHGGDHARISLGESPLHASEERGDGVDVLDLHEKLVELATIDPDLARVVELRYFGGLSVPETAEAAGIPLRTVERRLRAASAWLRERLSRDTDGPETH